MSCLKIDNLSGLRRSDLWAFSCYCCLLLVSLFRYHTCYAICLFLRSIAYSCYSIATLHVKVVVCVSTSFWLRMQINHNIHASLLLWLVFSCPRFTEYTRINVRRPLNSLSKEYARSSLKHCACIYKRKLFVCSWLFRLFNIMKLMTKHKRVADDSTTITEHEIRNETLVSWHDTCRVTMLLNEYMVNKPTPTSHTNVKASRSQYCADAASNADKHVAIRLLGLYSIATTTPGQYSRTVFARTAPSILLSYKMSFVLSTSRLEHEMENS
jgi:hypothetical protein